MIYFNGEVHILLKRRCEGNKVGDLDAEIRHSRIITGFRPGIGALGIKQISKGIKPYVITINRLFLSNQIPNQ